MIFAVSNISYYIYKCDLREKYENKYDFITGTADTALIASAAVIGGLILGGAISVGAGSVAHYFSWGLIVSSIVVIFVDGVFMIKKIVDKHQTKQELEILPINEGSLKDISINTLALVKQGYYTNSQKIKIPLQSGDTLHMKSRVIKYDEKELMPVVSRGYEQKIFITLKDSLVVAGESIERNNKVAVLNFAGPEEVGGGFLDGTAGQEEKLIYRTDFESLMDYYHNEQDKNPDFKIYPLYDHLLLTQDVTVFRDSKFAALDNPFKVGILTSAAPVPKPTFAPTGFCLVGDGDDIHYEDENTKEQLRKIIYTQLKTAYDFDYDAIVLGAFGCGAFKNPPKIIANVYREVIDAYFKGAFKEIAFAILDCPQGRHNPKRNILPFKECFPD